MVCLFLCDVLHLISVAMAILPVQELVQVSEQLLYIYASPVAMVTIGYYSIIILLNVFKSFFAKFVSWMVYNEETRIIEFTFYYKQPVTLRRVIIIYHVGTATVEHLVSLQQSTPQCIDQLYPDTSPLWHYRGPRQPQGTYVTHTRDNVYILYSENLL